MSISNSGTSYNTSDSEYTTTWTISSSSGTVEVGSFTIDTNDWYPIEEEGDMSRLTLYRVFAVNKKTGVIVEKSVIAENNEDARYDVLYSEGVAPANKSLWKVTAQEIMSWTPIESDDGELV